MSITVDPSAALETETHSGSTMTVSETPMSSDSCRVQLRPVGFPSPVTQLFDYILHAWDFQKGDHCTYKYTPSRESHLEMSASVVIRLPNKPSLLVKDSKYRVSRVLAQNAVAQLALEKLAAADPELKAKMDALAEEIEINRLNSELAPPPPPPHRYASNPGYPSWRSATRQHHYNNGYYDYPQAYYPPPPFGMYPMPYGAPVVRSNSAPEIDQAEVVTDEHVAPYYDQASSEFYYYSAAPALEPSTSNVTDGHPSPSNGPAVMTPTGPNWPHYPAAPQYAWPYYAPAYGYDMPYDMYYPEEGVESSTATSKTPCH